MVKSEVCVVMFRGMCRDRCSLAGFFRQLRALARRTRSRTTGSKEDDNVDDAKS